MPVLLGIIAPFWLARDVRTAWYLKPEERAFAEKRMVVDSAANFDHGHKVTARDFKEAFTDWRVWAIMVSNTLASLSSQGFTIFFPVVVKVCPCPLDVSLSAYMKLTLNQGLGYSKGAIANLMTVPPYVAGAIGVWAFSYSSDRFQERTVSYSLSSSDLTWLFIEHSGQNDLPKTMPYSLQMAVTDNDIIVPFACWNDHSDHRTCPHHRHSP